MIAGAAERTLRIAGILFLVLLACFALLPGPVKGRFATVGWWHFGAHLAVFYIAFLLVAAGASGFHESLSLAAMLLGFGVAIELAQTRVYGTRIEYRDIAANTFGIVLALLSRSLRFASTVRH